MHTSTRLAFATLLTALCSLSLHGQVVINEYSCSNLSGITDSFGEQEDWVELYNSSGAPVDLTGYYLSDKDNNLTKWQIPSGSVPANGYLMVFCSRRGLVAGAEIHPDFGLTQTEGEWIILSNALGNVVDSLHMVHRTKADHSVGRTTDGATTWSLFTTPTPGASNTGGVNFYEPTPVMSLAPGFYSGSQSVTITCPDAAATIYYTTDGSDPTTSSNLYSGPVNIAATTVLRAVATGTQLPSFTETNTYFIGVTHTMPVVSICSNPVYDLIANGNQSAPSDRVGSFEFFEADQTFISEGQGHFNKHGNDSWAYQQRGFDFIMRDQFGYNDDIEHQVFPEKDRDEFQRLILKAAANDNYPFENGAHIRDAFVHTLSIRADLKLDERTWRPCVLYLNGQYWGVYDIREKVDDADYTEFYYGQNKFNLQYLKTWGSTWEEYGAPNAQPAWDNLEAYIMANNMGNAADFHYVDSLLNWESLVDYFVINSYIVSQDWLNWNTAWWRGMDPNEDKKKWRYTLWDMDATFGHYINYTGIPDPSANADPCNAENLPDPGSQGHTTVLNKLISENDQVRQYYITRYADLVNTHFSCSYMNQLLDSMIAEIAPEMPGQITRWGGTLADWQNNVQTMKNFIDLRCTALEQGLINCYNLSGPYDLTFDVSPAGGGEIRVNSVWAPSYPWSASYFGGIETLLRAKANSGYVFDHWEYQVGPLNQPASSDTNSIDVTQNETIVAVFRVTDAPPMGSEGMHLPTGFSPNGDGRNDFLRPIVGSDVASFTLYIYDRWGNRILQSSDPLLSWRGDFNGQMLNSGVYAYVIEVMYKDGSTETLSGNVTLIR